MKKGFLLLLLLALLVGSCAVQEPCWPGYRAANDTESLTDKKAEI